MTQGGAQSRRHPLRWLVDYEEAKINGHCMNQFHGQSDENF